MAYELDRDLKGSEVRLWKMIEERTQPGADVARIDERIWDLFGEEWAVMFTDLSGFSRNVAEFGIIHFLQVIFEQKRLLLPIAARNDGILIKVEAYGEIATIVRHHHERVDGFGYPDGLVGEEIPLISRIICAADAYNAMTSDRPYRDAMPDSVARRRLLEASGSQFDADVIDAFLETLGAEPEAFHIPTLADDAIGRAADLGFSELPQSAAA